MERLDKVQIQFIDNYLENTEVIHFDIKSEMVDHVASSIEAKIESGDTRDFYYIFKDYMVENKNRLLDNNKKFLKTTDKKLAIALLKQLISFQGVLVFLGTLTILYLLQNSFGNSIIKSWLLGLPLIGFVLFGLGYFFGLKFLKLERYSAVERISFVLNAFFQVFHLIWIFSKRRIEDQHAIYVFILLSIAMTLLFALIKVTISMIKSYQSNFKSLA